jgi:inner membrane protein
LTRNIDVRWLMVGALLPDIMDKPLSLLHFGSGRSIAHTLLFLLVFVTAGLFLFLWRKWKTVLVLAAGIFTHLILDSMWKEPNTLFWPFRGAHFSAGNPSAWISLWEKLITQNPAVYTGEIIGFVIVIWFGWWLWKRKQITVFIKKGYLP